VFRDHGTYVIFVSLYWFAQLVAGLTAKGRVRYHVGPCVLVCRVEFRTGLSSIFTRPVSFLHHSIPIHSLSDALDSDVNKTLTKLILSSTLPRLNNFVSVSNHHRFKDVACYRSFLFSDTPTPALELTQFPFEWAL